MKDGTMAPLTVAHRAGMIVGRALMVGLGAFYWLYTLRPRLPVMRALPYFWQGNLPRAPEWRAFAALVGTLFVTGGASPCNG